MPTATLIGAGPAGATAALLLARAGWDVTLVEQHAFPRHKVCGECLSHLGHQVLTRLGLSPAFHHAGAVPLTRTLLHSPRETAAEIPLPHPMWGLSRHALDPLLLRAATTAGARLLQPYRCERLDGTRCEVRNLTTNEITSLASDYVLLADGRRALHHHPKPTSDLGVKAHFTQVDSPRDAIELFSLPGHYVGLAPVENHRWNLAASVPASRLRAHQGDLDALFRQLLTDNPALARAFRRAERVTDWLASPLPRFGVSATFPPGVVPIGNAAAAIEPIGGEGMGLALRSAELAAHALIEAGPDRHHPSLRQLTADYHRLWRTSRPACRAGALVLSSTRLAPVAVDLLSTLPGFATPPLQLIGK